jgi:hypothetical protein
MDAFWGIKVIINPSKYQSMVQDVECITIISSQLFARCENIQASLMSFRSLLRIFALCMDNYK